jgi:hypothetical protein
MARNCTTQVALYTTLALISLVIGCYINTGGGGCNGGNYRAKAERTEEMTVPLADITALDIATNVGTIRLDSDAAAEAHITAAITVRSKTEERAWELIDQVRISAEPSGRKLIVKAIKPPGFGRNQLSVDFTVTAPGQLAVECSTNVGDIKIRDFSDKVAAKTDVGKIVCSGLRNRAEFHTNVGDIRAAYALDAPAAVELSASTNVGNVEFAGPNEISARLSASTNVGAIDTDRPLSVTGQIKKSVNATLGDAEGRITLRTNVGSVEIR